MSSVGRLHLVRQLDEHAQGKRVVNDRLSDVENANVAARQNRRERMRHARVVVTGDIYVENARVRLSGHGEQ